MMEPMESDVAVGRRTEPLTDSSTELRSSDPRLAAWRAFLMAHALVSRRLDEDLRAAHGLSLAEYSALLQLAQAPAGRLRMNQVADGVFLSRSGVTRLIDRLESDGLVNRGGCPSDKRGAEATLTEAGLSRLRAASQVHLRGIATYFLGPIESADLDSIERALGAVGARVQRDGRAPEMACAAPEEGPPLAANPVAALPAPAIGEPTIAD